MIGLAIVFNNYLNSQTDLPYYAFIFDYQVGVPDGTGWRICREFQSITTTCFPDEDNTDHLGEDWNWGSTPEADQGQPVYAIASGKIIHFSHYPDINSDPYDDEGNWGGVVMIQHHLPPWFNDIPNDSNGQKYVVSMYAHLGNDPNQQYYREFADGEYVRRGQLIGYIGSRNENGGWSPHLHLEIRTPLAEQNSGNQCNNPECLGPGYSTNASGWIDPSEFIDRHRPNLPLSGDWNNDHYDTIGDFRNKVLNDNFYITFRFDNNQPVNGSRTLNDSNAGQEVDFWQGGINPAVQPGDIPIVGDWDGNGFDEIGVFRPKEDDSNQSTFYLDLHNDTTEVRAVDFSYWPQDIPIVGDWDGDEDDDIGGYSSSNYTFYLYTINREQVPWTAEFFAEIPLGDPFEYPVIGDWDRDGDDDIGIFRPEDPNNQETNSFYLFKIDRSVVPPQLGEALGRYELDNLGDIPIIGDWDGDRDDNIGVYHPTLPNTGQFFFREDLPPDIPSVPIIAEFGASRTTGVAPLTVNFTDESTGDVIGWLWDFGDGNTSNVQNPQHTYTQPGLYTVTLTASNPSGSNTRMKSDYISVSSPTDVYVLSGTVTINGIPVRIDMNAFGNVRATETSGANQGSRVDIQEGGQYQMALFPGTYNVLVDYWFWESWGGTWTSCGTDRYPAVQDLEMVN